MTTSNEPVRGFRIPIALRWSDLDALNHVNNARYFTFLEQARIEWFKAIGEPWLTDESAPLVASVTINYKRPIEYPSGVFVELIAGKPGTSSVVVGHRITAADGSLYCDGHVVMVWVDRSSGVPTSLPPAIRRAIEEGLG